MATCSEKRCTGVEFGIMVEGSGEGRMRVTKDVATLPAVVAASKVAESSLASRVVADSGFGIGLQRPHVSNCELQESDGNNSLVTGVRLFRMFGLYKTGTLNTRETEAYGDVVRGRSSKGRIFVLHTFQCLRVG
jgi:hypothetical protein